MQPRTTDPFEWKRKRGRQRERERESKLWEVRSRWKRFPDLIRAGQDVAGGRRWRPQYKLFWLNRWYRAKPLSLFLFLLKLSRRNVSSCHWTHMGYETSHGPVTSSPIHSSRSPPPPPSFRDKRYCYAIRTQSTTFYASYLLLLSFNSKILYLYVYIYTYWMKLFKLFTIFNFDSKLRIIQSRRKVSKEISRFFSKIYLVRTQGYRARLSRRGFYPWSVINPSDVRR